MVSARQLGMLAGARHDVVDFEPSDQFCFAPGTHRGEIGAMRRVLGSHRPLGAIGPAPSAAVAVAALHRAPRDRPPVVRPEQLAAAVAAPRPAPRRQRGTAPRARARRRRRRERADREQRVLFRHGRPRGTVNETTRPLRNVTVYWSMSASSYSHTVLASSDARVRYPCGKPRRRATSSRDIPTAILN